MSLELILNFEVGKTKPSPKLAGRIVAKIFLLEKSRQYGTNGEASVRSRPKPSSRRSRILMVACLAIIAGGITLAAMKKVSAANSTVITYSHPSGTAESAVFSVTVNGTSVFVEDTGNNTNYAHFSFTGEVNIVITVIETVNQYTLSPKSYNIPSTKIGQTVIFSLDRPRKLILHEINSLDDILFIFADPLEEDPPQIGSFGVTNIIDYEVDNSGATDETTTIQGAINDVSTGGGGVLYFPAGKYRASTLYVKDNVKMYLAGGARIYWAGLAYLYFDTISGASMGGRGMIDGHMVRVYNSDNLTIQDILIKTHVDGWWALEILYSDYFTGYNIKIINNWSITSDGFDPHYSSHILIDNCFTFSGDDACSIHAKDLTIKTDIQDVNVRNCVFYTGSSGCKIGTRTWNNIIDDITFENIDIVSYSHRALNINPGDYADISDIFFKNIRVEKWIDRSLGDEGVIYFVIWTRSWPPSNIAAIDDVYIQNLDVDLKQSSTINGKDDAHKVSNVTIDNYWINGDLVESIVEGNVSVNDYVSNLTFANSNSPIVNINATDDVASELPINTAIFTISRTGDDSQKITVNYIIRGTAINSTDYQTINDSVILSAGNSSTTVTITPINDAIEEGLETVFISLENITHSTNSYILGPDFHAVVNIIDDDNDPPATPSGLRFL